MPQDAGKWTGQRVYRFYSWLVLHLERGSSQGPRGISTSGDNGSPPPPAKSGGGSTVVEFQTAEQTADTWPYVKAGLGYTYAITGDRAKAEQTLRELDDLAKQRYIAAWIRVSIYVGLGENEKALDWLERAYEEQDGLWDLKTNRIYDTLRAHPRFQALLKKVGLDK